MTTILGISGFYHDASAAILADGKIIAAAQEERFSRIKHDPSFPVQAIEFCLKKSGFSVEELDHVVFYEKPFLKFERILETYLANAPRGYRSFLTSMPIWLRSKLYISTLIQKGLSGKYRKRIIFPEHHESHAASAFFCSPFERAAIITVDGVGEWATTTFGTGQNNNIKLTNQISFPDSLGLLYSAFTYFCGFRVNGGEGKLMGLAPYGQPIYSDLILEKLIDLKDDGSFRLNQEYFGYCAGQRMTSAKFDTLFDGPARVPESSITDREMNIAASIQEVAELVLLKIASYVQAETKMKNLCIAGGVGLNCVANGRLLRESPFEQVWIQPAAGDCGGAIGAALFAWHQLLEKPRKPVAFNSPYLGRDYSCEETAIQLGQSGAKFTQFTSDECDESKLYGRVATELTEQKVVGWFQGPAEFGPRALGNRSVLADPRCEQMRDTLNRKVQFRETFRPFAPVVLAAYSNDYFDLETESPYMLLAANVCNRADAPATGDQALVPVPAVTHVDKSARVQTVNKDNNLKLHNLLTEFESQTGCPVLLNTSFNVRGEPIVNSIQDAYRCFMQSEMDILVIENCLLSKPEQPPYVEPEQTKSARSTWHKLLATWMTITFLPRFIVSNLALSLVYFCCILPIGLFCRIFKREAFQPIDQGAPSYWQPRPEDKDKSTYFKQY